MFAAHGFFLFLRVAAAPWQPKGAKLNRLCNVAPIRNAPMLMPVADKHAQTGVSSGKATKLNFSRCYLSRLLLKSSGDKK
jgi:hypothetical protein